MVFQTHNLQPIKWKTGFKVCLSKCNLHRYILVLGLCSVSTCARSKPLPARPGGKYAEFGPLKTRLVTLSAAATRDYGFPGAVVACPVLPRTTGGGGFSSRNTSCRRPS